MGEQILRWDTATMGVQWVRRERKLQKPKAVSVWPCKDAAA